MESRFEETIEKMKLPIEVFNIFKSFVLKKQEENKNTAINSIPQIQ